MKKIAIFDLDGTVIDSDHRTPNKADGTLDLDRYFELKTRENIFRDTVLPLAERMKEMYDSGDWHIVICTARDMDQNDFDFLADNDLKFHECFDKYTRYVFFDDARPIIDTFSTYPNVDMIDATIENKRLSYGN